MRKDVKKAISWIEKFEQKAHEEIDRITHVDEGIEHEISDLKEQIVDLNSNQDTLVKAKKKIENLLKVLGSE